MQTSKPQHLPQLDIFRGVAILSVFLYHSLIVSFGDVHFNWNGNFPDFAHRSVPVVLSPLSLGGLGVAVFFVISGFCIHLSHARSSESNFRVFFLRRFFRIYPPYLVAMVVFFFMHRWGPMDLKTFNGLAQFVSHLGLIHNLDSRTLFGINPSFWSIAAEAQLYVLYPILWWVGQRWGWTRALIFSGVIEGGLRVGEMIHSIQFPLNELPAWLTFSPFGFWFSWCIGAALADAHLQGRNPVVRTGALWLVAGLALAAEFVRPLTGFAFPLVALLTTGIISKSLSRETRPPRRGISWVFQGLGEAGLVSYSLYLIHQPLITLVPEMLSWLSPKLDEPLLRFLGCVLFLFPVYLGAKLFYRWVETPSIALGKIVIARQRRR